MASVARRLPVAALLLAALGCAATPKRGARPPAHDRPHRMNALVGGSFDRHGDGPALGVNYEYRTKDRLGVGGFADVAFGDDTSTVLGGCVLVHPDDRWTLFAGPSVEFAKGDADVLARVGGWYAIPLDKMTLAPTGWVDLGDGVSLFLGVGFVIDF